MPRRLRIGFPRSVRVSLDQGSYTSAGAAVGLNRNYSLVAAAGSYSVTGQDITLTVGGVAVPPPIAGTPGTVVQLGAQTLNAHLTAVRTALPEGLAAANGRLLPISGTIAFCGATIWRNKYSLGALGGHGDSFDDGHYVFDLASQAWETLLPPSTAGGAGIPADSFGEWGITGRPASQHSFYHLLTVNDDIVECWSGAAGYLASSSRQAHRWKGSTGAWERFGLGGSVASNGISKVAFHDPVRNRIVRFTIAQGGPVDTLSPATDANATWSTTFPANPPPFDIYCQIGYHQGLDCFVLIDQQQAPLRNRMWVMDPDAIATGWVEVSVSGVFPYAGAADGGLEYVPPMRALAFAATLEPSNLYFLAPTGGRTAPWVWTRQTFTGTTAEWVTVQGNYNDPYNRLRWSSLLNGLVTIKNSASPMEIFYPTLSAAAADWAARSTEPGVVVAYDFSAPPVNGGDWKWGSLKASPKITCYAQDDTFYGANRTIDNAITPPGSSAALRFVVPCPAGEMGDLWHIYIDDYADQFGANSEFWVQWRVRMSPSFAQHLFSMRNVNDPTGPDIGHGTTQPKHIMIGQGVPPTMIGMDPGLPNGYINSSTSFSNNKIQFAPVDFEGELNLIAGIGTDASYAEGEGFKYPKSYHGKPGYIGLTSYGQDGTYFTEHNSGNEVYHVAACQYNLNGGGTYTDKSTCFIYPADQWFTLMVHVKMGAKGSDISSLGASARAMQASFVNQTSILMAGPNSGVDATVGGGLHVRIYGAQTNVTARVTSTAALLFPLADVSGTIFNEPLLVDQQENGYINSTVEYFGAYQGGAMQLLHRKSAMVMRVGNYSYTDYRSNPDAKFGQFAFTTFMTSKSYSINPTTGVPYDNYSYAAYWVGQVVIKSGAVPPSTPAF